MRNTEPNIIFIAKVTLAVLGLVLFYGLQTDLFSGFELIKSSNSAVDALIGLIFIGTVAVLFELIGDFIGSKLGLNNNKKSRLVRMTLALIIVGVLLSMLYLIGHAVGK
jgi:intracellular septation protein A